MSTSISFVIATRNRLPLLKITLSKLWENIRPQDEICIVDGNSSDGTVAFAQQLLAEGKINSFRSEKDRNQSHAWNKAFLDANGTYIKKIIDDDVFDYPSIFKCADEMDKFPEADICISNDLTLNLGSTQSPAHLSRFSWFQKWASGEIPSFTFGDVHMLIRRSSLPLIGLYHPGFVLMDYEYSLRISHLQAGILYYTGFNALSIYSPVTVTHHTGNKRKKNEGERLSPMYEYAGDAAQIPLWSKIKVQIGRWRDNLTGNQKKLINRIQSQANEVNLTEFYSTAYSLLRKENEKLSKSEFFLGPFKHK
jgi:glycosyltransferase involved in cell wall biosynthesis